MKEGRSCAHQSDGGYSCSALVSASFSTFKQPALRSPEQTSPSVQTESVQFMGERARGGFMEAGDDEVSLAPSKLKLPTVFERGKHFREAMGPSATSGVWHTGVSLVCGSSISLAASSRWTR